MGRLSSEKQSDNAEGSNVEETGMISGVSELDLSVTITTEGSRFLGKTASCSRFDYKRSSIKWRNSHRNPQLHIGMAGFSNNDGIVLKFYLSYSFHPREQLFACGYPLSAATGLGRLFRTGEPVRCQVRPVGARLQACTCLSAPTFNFSSKVIF